jgi:hypothetical protein
MYIGTWCGGPCKLLHLQIHKKAKVDDTMLSYFRILPNLLTHVGRKLAIVINRGTGIIVSC